MNQHPTDPTNPVPEHTAWEEAMSRDFDARVRDLHEAPLDIDTVKGKAHKIKRNRRAAVAGGILGVAAIVTPIAVLTNDNGNTRTQEVDVADPSETAEITDPATGVDYIVNGTWHQADGEVVALPDNANPYDAAVLWNDQLVATRWDGEVFSIADVIDDEGNVVYSFDTAGEVVVNEAGTTIAWVATDGNVMTRWEDDPVSLGTVDMAAPGETIAWSATAITGGPNCDGEVDGCLVFLDSALGEEPTTFSSLGTQENPIPDAIAYRDASTISGVQVTFQDTLNADNTVCTGLYDLDSGDARWNTCDYDAQAISPNAQYVVGAPNYGSGLGHAEIAILDAADGIATGQYGAEGGHISSDVAWSAANTLVFSAWDGSRWHLISMAPDGNFAEVAEPQPGDEVSSPFTIVQH